MESPNPTSAPRPGEIDLALWREFQGGLTALLDIPISLYDGKGRLLSPPTLEPCICSRLRGHDEARRLCEEMCRASVLQVIEKRQLYVYKCHLNQYIFAVPAFFNDAHNYVIIGGQVYLAGSELKDFYSAVAELNLDRDSVEELKAGIRTIPPRSIFTIPGIVNNLAVPFLGCLYRRAVSERGAPDAAAYRRTLRGFFALEEVYRAIAPVLDREELYQTILMKSTELLGAASGSLMILDNKQNVLSVKAARGIDRKALAGVRVKVGEGISGTIAARGTPVIVRNIEAEVPRRKNRPRYKTKSFISLPLKLDTRVIGVINISDKISGEVFSDEDLYLLMSFANYASIALERGAYYSMTEELKMISMTDSLTGLFNRRYFKERLFEEVERVKRHGGCFSIFIIDIDNFKSFNDRFGHQAGDLILKGVSRAIRDAVRSMDVVSRYGGEEFSVILPHTNKKDAYVIAERIRKGVEGYVPPPGPLREWPTISLGVAEFPADAGSIDELVDRADRAMYAAKQMGKNRVVVYER